MVPEVFLGFSPDERVVRQPTQLMFATWQLSPSSLMWRKIKENLCNREGLFKLFLNYRYIWVFYQVWGQDGWIWTKTESRSINMQKRTRPISSHLDGTSLVNKCLILWRGGNFSCRTRQVVQSGQDSFILPAQVIHIAPSQSYPYNKCYCFIRLQMECAWVAIRLRTDSFMQQTDVSIDQAAKISVTNVTAVLFRTTLTRMITLYELTADSSWWKDFQLLLA